MADNLCGPSTAPKSLSQHFERDRSLQQDRFASSAGPSSGVRDATQSFRSLNLGDNRFTSDFSGFQNSTFLDNSQLMNGPHLVTSPPRVPAAGNSLTLNPAEYARFATFPRPTDDHMFGSGLQNPMSWNPTNWAQQFNQTTARADPNTVAYKPMPSSFTDFGSISRFHGNLYQPSLPMSLDGHQSFRDSGNDNIDFDAELRAWAAANDPETQAQADAWLSTNHTASDDSQRHTQATAQSADAHQLTQRNLAAVDQETVAPVEEPTLSTSIESETIKEEPVQSRGNEDSELAAAAQQILDSVSGNTSDKFKNSSFIQMMQKIAAQELVVRDNNLVESPQTIAD
ncbi:hypothetical protein F5Y11DRAFT_88520 [Daldinia sp. FL1419]|nr:hypothetical protein F5Y11DRAFT_88520 [Daldinia sp. FL1419]